MDNSRVTPDSNESTLVKKAALSISTLIESEEPQKLRQRL